MLSGTMTAALLWLAASTGTPVAVRPEIAPAVENIYYVQIDGMT
jgi:hypothetical protein